MAGTILGAEMRLCVGMLSQPSPSSALPPDADLTSFPPPAYGGPGYGGPPPAYGVPVYGGPSPAAAADADGGSAPPASGGRRRGLSWWWDPSPPPAPLLYLLHHYLDCAELRVGMQLCLAAPTHDIAADVDFSDLLADFIAAADMSAAQDPSATAPPVPPSRPPAFWSPPPVRRHHPPRPPPSPPAPFVPPSPPSPPRAPPSPDAPASPPVPSHPSPSVPAPPPVYGTYGGDSCRVPNRCGAPPNRCLDTAAGSYECACAAGFVLRADGATCVPPAENVALRKRAYSSSVLRDGSSPDWMHLPHWAVDGDTSSMFAAAEAAEAEDDADGVSDPEPFLSVDLGARYGIGRVEVSGLLSSAAVYVTDAPVASAEDWAKAAAAGAQLCWQQPAAAEKEGPAAASTYAFSCGGGAEALGRWVVLVNKNAPQGPALRVAEIRVYGTRV
ncbi:hypothetical protein HYH02_001346 [Chlamydomonas schloesseri]|uniref:EGF-like domain-containing protein n=1 Tax=Chlamydomonas schloesseri TaxID=2026947 RepID=A0A835WU58_9CHLO|nr:hypothetical protein HYH02_001346 [Chlamydomonas schloesseri]|eukprot:KAG2454319.1 hypothetical protein HYH02_001346 [Chlamydomonas schloesseri]